MNTAFYGINVLRWHYGMIGQPKTNQCPKLEPIEEAFALALGTTDPATFECLCPVLIFNNWEARKLIVATAQSLRGRLRLAASIGLFFMDFSRLGMLDPLGTTVELKAVREQTKEYTMANDPWNETDGANEPDGLFLEFFRPFGLYINWPLVDFIKQYKWASIRNQERINKMILATAGNIV